MARRNRKLKAQQTPARSRREAAQTPEDAKQEKTFFLWAGAITLLVVLLVYFFIFD